MKLKLLIADDDATTRRILQRAVALLGHEVIAVNDGRELVERFAEIRPDLILTDWRMPEMDGVEAIERIRSMPGGHEVFIVLSTGVYGASETASAIEAGADDYILKPISVPALRVLLMLSGERIARRRTVTDGVRAVSDSGLPGLVEYFPGAMVTTDLEGRVCAVNPAGATAWNVAEGSVLADVFSELDRPALKAAFVLAAAGTAHTFAHHDATDRSRHYQTCVWPLWRDSQVSGFGVSTMQVVPTQAGESPHRNAG
ncbi:MAG: response regulator [Myxococcales bacterium FL481]|nr:MAG: response regulator [Myxococcales bacterium FL481]